MILKEVCNIYLGHGLFKKNCNWKFKIFEAEGQKKTSLYKQSSLFLLFKKI